MRAEVQRANILVFRPSGHLETEFVELFKQVVDEGMKHGAPHVFWDGETMTGYDSEFRQRIGQYCVSVKNRVSSMNVYTPNPFVAMGAAVVNVWLGGFFNISKTREDFERVLAAVR